MPMENRAAWKGRKAWKSNCFLKIIGSAKQVVDQLFLPRVRGSHP